MAEVLSWIGAIFLGALATLTIGFLVEIAFRAWKSVERIETLRDKVTKLDDKLYKLEGRIERTPK